MPAAAAASLTPRKQPVQRRSEATVEALFEAAIQVLLASGYRKLTTTRVATRAGVSVGSLYQYFPNREALIAAVIERYLETIRITVAERCEAMTGRPLAQVAEGLADAFVDAKWRRIDLAVALRPVLAEVGGSEMARASGLAAVQAIAATLAACPDVRFDDANAAALFVTMAASAVLQAAIAAHGDAADADDVRRHLRAMVKGYLAESAAVRP